MLIDLLQSVPGHHNHNLGSVDRLITGNYKSNGNLVSLKVDIIDFTDFQKNGCLVSPGTGGLSASHTHNITGTLFCQPDSNTVRLNITVLGTCSQDKPWETEPSIPPLKDVKPWVMTTNKMTSGTTENSKNMQYSPFTSPVSPPSRDNPPALLDFHSDQLMSEIHSMSFDYGCGVNLNSQLLHETSSPCVLTSPCQAVSQGLTSNTDAMKVSLPPLQLSQSILVKPYSVNVPTSLATGLSTAKSTTASDLNMGQQTLLQPKIERSDSICSEYNREDFLSYTDDLGNLDDLDEPGSYTTSPTTISSPLLFPSSSILSSSPTLPSSAEKNNFFTKSFTSKPQDVLTHATTSSSTWQVITQTSSSNPPSVNTFGPAPSRSPKTGNGSPSSDISASPREPSFLINTSPKPRNRRNSSFDETKPHVCAQCGARFTTKSNLGQHAKIHLAVKPFICEICSHGFTRAAHYESHVAKHKGLKTHRCDQCGESFARLDNLLRHSARHKHGKIFDCSICGKGFHRKDKLIEHEKVHSEYKFPCDKCSKTFHTNDALKHHLPLHEDLTKTQCNICLKFITIKSLSKHMSAFHKESLSSSENNNNVNKSRARKGTEEKTNPCQYCRKSFVSPAKLRLHVAKCHAAERHKLSTETILQQTIEEKQFESRNFFDEFTMAKERYSSPSGDSLPSQQVPEMDLSYINSSPEDLNDVHSTKELRGDITATFQIPTIHIPEFESKLGPTEISTEALQALLFN